ncbi:MAG TPA: ribosome-binding factor A [Candidatus Paceibacterota bacterium]|nr:ribosome-binding factor A [Candidatus Paceibacterota bacterium]
MSFHKEKEESLLQSLIAEYLNREAGTKSLITVTHCDMTPDSKKVTAYISVIPENLEEEALNFAKRRRPEIRQHIKEHSRLHHLPHVEVAIDEGEKNRQNIERLLREG